MIHYMTEKHSRYFQENLVDWCAGGPKEGGWTRAGEVIALPEVELVSFVESKKLHVDEVLAKNKDEVHKWHLAFLDGSPQGYYSEYLDLRYDAFQADERASTFLDLLEDMRLNGFDESHPVWVADVSELNLGFDYFRFDGCHRTCCAKHLGIKEVPVHIFSTKVLSRTSTLLFL